MVLAGCNLIFHLAQLRILAINPVTPIHAALGAVIMLVQTMAGRVIPGFTANAIPTARIRRYRWIAFASHLMLGLALIAVIAEISPRLTALLTCIAAMLLLLNLWCWDSLSTVRKPILWILHVSYAWISAGLLMMAAAQLTWIPISLAWHALGVGAMSGMISGMITRTALGHTGRPLIAGRVEIAFYGLVNLAAMVRVIPGMFSTNRYDESLVVAGIVWTMAFLTYSWGYFPILTRPRIDGRPG
jgi:uncharacterized protein involved in response to NO